MDLNYKNPPLIHGLTSFGPPPMCRMPKSLKPSNLDMVDIWGTTVNIKY